MSDGKKPSDPKPAPELSGTDLYIARKTAERDSKDWRREARRRLAKEMAQK